MGGTKVTDLQRCRRVINLDKLYLAWDSAYTDALEEKEPDVRKALLRLSRHFRKRYDALVADGRKVNT